VRIVVDSPEGVIIEGDQDELESLSSDLEDAAEFGESVNTLITEEGTVPLIVRCRP